MIYSGWCVMPIEIEIDRQSDITFVICQGFIVVRDLADLKARLSGVERPTRCVLIDLYKANFGLPYQDIEWFARVERACTRVAIYAPRPVAFGVSRMYQMLSQSGGALGVFSDRDKALAWLRNSAQIAEAECGQDEGKRGYG